MRKKSPDSDQISSKAIYPTRKTQCFDRKTIIYAAENLTFFFQPELSDEIRSAPVWAQNKESTAAEHKKTGFT